MTRKAVMGALAFGVGAAVAGYVWVAFEFPFALVLAGVVGWLALGWPYGPRKAWTAALVGGVSFTAAFLVGLFFAITDGSPFALPAWLVAAAAAAVAGALGGAVIAGKRGALVVALYSAAGMFVGEVLSWALQSIAPAATDVPGPAQSFYFALAIGLIGAAIGAATGLALASLDRGNSDAAGPVPNAAGPTPV